MPLPTVREKKRFIRDLVKSVQATLLATVDRMPAEWDGHELRELIADKFEHETTDLIAGRRLRQYRNEVLVRNL